MIYFVLAALLSLSPVEQETSAAPIKVKLCELQRNGWSYDSRVVEVHATYRYAFENSGLYCMGCADEGETWVRFDDDLKIPRKLRGHEGTFDVTFIGVFHTGERYGHMAAYKSELQVNRIVRAKRLSKSGVVPAALPQKVQEKLCR